MRLSGKLSAAIEILDDFQKRRVPLKTAIADWGRNNRYAGSKDRAWISGLCLDALRQKSSLENAMGAETSRALVLGTAGLVWKIALTELTEAAAEEPHGPGTLSDDEVAGLGAQNLATDAVDFPEWLGPFVDRAFGDQSAAEMAAFAQRADIDLRLNSLKATPEKSLQALKSVKAVAVPMVATSARIAAPDPSVKAPAVTVIPAFNKGWVEVQDLGSQIAAAAAGNINGAQVLDFCAGGGGKTLALSAMMENTGQLYAYDIDARRLKPLFHRAKRAGVRNLQIRSPAGSEGLDDLVGKMDVVFVDAPCTGSGTWRRHPDTKWRLKQTQLQRRMDEQDQVLAAASKFVKPGGRLVYVTCSFFHEENEDRLEKFLRENTEFSARIALDDVRDAGLASQEGLVSQKGLVSHEGLAALKKCETADGALRLTPYRVRTDGFFIATLMRETSGKTSS